MSRIKEKSAETCERYGVVVVEQSQEEEKMLEALVERR